MLPSSWGRLCFCPRIVGPLLRRGLSLVAGALWKVAVESVACLEDTQTKQMWFVLQHVHLYQHMRAPFMPQF